MDSSLITRPPNANPQGEHTIGDVTEAMHRWLLEGWSFEGPPPRLEEDLSFIPKDRESVIFTYMYRIVENTDLRNPKRDRPTPFSKPNEDNPQESVLYYEWPPVYLNVFYLLTVHAKFNSDAERLLGWAMMRLHQATQLVYRPRRYVLPDGAVVDSNGNPWSRTNRSEGLFMEKVSLSLVDDLTVGDAINFYTIHEAPYRPYATYMARCSIRGAIKKAAPTVISTSSLETADREGAIPHKSGYLSSHTSEEAHKPSKTPGPKGFGVKSKTDKSTKEG